MTLVLALLFLLGIANFALHRAVLESGHPALARIAWLRRRGPLALSPSLLLEFGVLLAAMLFVGGGLGGIAWVYALYTALNAGTAWIVLTGRL